MRRHSKMLMRKGTGAGLDMLSVLCPTIGNAEVGLCLQADRGPTSQAADD